MRVIPYQLPWSSTILRAWAIVWLLVVPLIHVHPEIDHHHGEAGHVHAGTVHTIFSPDLDGEFDSSHTQTGVVGHSTPNHLAVSGHPSHSSDYAELGFAFVSDSTIGNSLSLLSHSGW